MLCGIDGMWQKCYAVSVLPDAWCVQFCHRLTKEAGVTLIPVSAFYDDRSRAPCTLVRFVFCKTDEKLQTAVQKLQRYLAKS